MNIKIIQQKKNNIIVFQIYEYESLKAFEAIFEENQI